MGCTHHDDVVSDQRLSMLHKELSARNISPNITYRRILSACVPVEEYHYDRFLCYLEVV
jgi:hypothetical protein